MLIPNSIRWRLPLSYAMIALLAALALGAVLLTTLRGYYTQREYDHLRDNALVISRTVSEMYRSNLSNVQIQTQMQGLSFLSQSRIRILDSAGTIIVDSGEAREPRVIALNYNPGILPPDILYEVEQYGYGIPAQAAMLTANPSEAWRASIDIFPRFMPSGSEFDIPIPRRFLMAVAGTPYGFNLNTDAALEGRSDQHIQVPFYDSSNTSLGYVELLDGPAYGTEIVDGVARSLVTAGIAAVALAVFVGWFVSRQITAPLSTLTNATTLMAEGNLSVRVPMQRRDELGLLANAFDHMAGRVENTVITLRRFVADAAHELHTPITALHANLELAATEKDRTQLLIFVERAQEQLNRLETMTRSLLDLSRIEADERRDDRVVVDLVAIFSEVNELYASRAEQAGITFHFNAPEEKLLVMANETQMRRVISNLLDNAIKFTPEDGIIHVGLRREANYLKLWVQDTGIGIPAEDLPHLFSRFRRARNAAAFPGSGLGLAIIKAIVEGHDGKVTVETSVVGTCFTFQLPVTV